MRIYELPRCIRHAIVSTLAVIALFVLPAHGQDLGPDRKVGGIPVGILKDALNSANATKRQRLFALIKQRISRDGAARQKFLEADVTVVGPRLARFQYSTQMLTAARGETTDAALQAKIDELVAAIETARASSPQ